MRNRVALLTAIGVFVAAVVGLALVADGGGDDEAGPDRGLPKLSYAAGSGALRDEASGGASADMALYPARGAYRLASPLAKPAETAPAYKVDGADEDGFKRLAAAFGLRPAAGDDYAWVAEGADAAQLRVDKRTGMWWYGVGGSDTAVSSAAVGECAPCPPDQVCTMECKPTQPPAGLPTEDEARQVARQTWEKAGIDPGDAELKVDNAFDALIVRFEPDVDGQPVLGLDTSVHVTVDKKLRYANGWLGEPEKIGDYPLISVEQAVDRLNNPPVYAGPVEDLGGREPAIATDSPAMIDEGAESSGSSGSGSSGSSGSSAGSTGAGGGTEPVPPVPPVKEDPPHVGTVVPHPTVVPEPVDLTGVRLALQWTGEFILPVYVFTAEGGIDGITVPAVPDDLLQLGGGQGDGSGGGGDQGRPEPAMLPPE